MIQKLLTINKELLDFVDNELKPKITITAPGLKDVTIALFAKSTKTFRALLILCHQQYGEDAAILARSLLEIVVNLAYIKKGASKRRAKLFVFYSFIANNKFLVDNPDISKGIVEEEFFHRHGKSVRVEKAFYEKERKRIKNKYHKCNNSWSCLTIKQMCEVVGKKFKNVYYNVVYWQLCKFSHPDADGLKSYFYEDGKGLHIKDLPSETWVKESLVLGFDCYFRIVCLVNEILKLGFEDKLKEVEKSYINNTSSVKQHEKKFKE